MRQKQGWRVVAGAAGVVGAGRSSETVTSKGKLKGILQPGKMRGAKDNLVGIKNTNLCRQGLSV